MPQDRYSAIGRPLDAREEQRWLRVYNDIGEDIPPFSFVTPKAMAYNGAIEVGKIAEDGDSLAMVTGHEWIKAGSWGRATRDFPARITYDEGTGTPAVGAIEDWGPAVNSFKAKKGRKGWKLIGPGSSGFPASEFFPYTALIEVEVCRP